MYIIEPRQVEQASVAIDPVDPLGRDPVPILQPLVEVKKGWRMYCRSVDGGLLIPVTALYPTSDAARRDPIGKAWAEYIPAIGALAVVALEWAWKKCEADPELKIGMPKEVIDAYRHFQLKHDVSNKTEDEE